MILDLRIDGRITAASVDALATPLFAAVDRAAPFAVLFDRRTMTAPTADGREALEAAFARWEGVEAHCVAWADLLDERRAGSLARATAAAAEAGEPEPHDHEHAYPQQTFTDEPAARAWLAAALAPVTA